MVHLLPVAARLPPQLLSRFDVWHVHHKGLWTRVRSSQRACAEATKGLVGVVMWQARDGRARMAAGRTAGSA